MGFRGKVRMWRHAGFGVLAATVVALGVASPSAEAAPGLFVGVADDTLQVTPAETSAIARDLGLGAYSLSLRWSAPQTTLSPAAAGSLGTAARAAGAARLVVYVYGDTAPASPEWREQYCAYTRDLITRFPQVNDVVIWNEPNLTYFWSPQFEVGGASLAPAQYEALLERCYDVLHAARPGVNVIAPASSPWGNDDPLGQSNVSHSPTSFMLQLGRAYRASGRTKPIFDTLGHHPHPVTSNERPWLRHSDARFVAIGDLDRLAAAAEEAFVGTAQRTPDRGLPIWYLETGYQTVPDADKRGLYTGIENWPGTLPAAAGGEPAQPPPAATSAAPDQATQLVDSLRLAYCQPHVQAYFTFQLRDERELGGWQSGVLWADGTRKGSYDAFRRTVAEVHAGSVDCTSLKGSTSTSPGAKPGGRPEGATAPGRGTTRTVDRRTPTTIAWAAPRPAPFGFARLAARLTRGTTPLAGRQVTFGFGGTLIVTTTDGKGVARARLAQPPSPGAHLVTASFRGSSTLAPSGLKVLLRVANTQAVLTTAGAARGLATVRQHLRIRSNGRTVQGMLRIRTRAGTVAATRFRALGVSRDGRSAWFAGTTARGTRVLGHVILGRAGGGDTLVVWRGGRAAPVLRGLDVRIVRNDR